MVASDSLNVISWVSKASLKPWRFQFFLNEIKLPVSWLRVEFCYVARPKDQNRSSGWSPKRYVAAAI